MTLQNLETELLKLSPAEKVRIISILSQSLANSWRGIEKTPNVCGGRACIANTRIPVWGLVNARRLGYSEADLLKNYPRLSASDLSNAWAYRDAFPEEIEQDIQDNEAEE